jgi:ATP-dependent DNA ligase
MSTLPFGPPIPPMLAKAVKDIPSQPGWAYEPKWDGFRCIVFYDGHEAYLQSRDLKPLGRYFPELKEGLEAALPGPAVVDGEIVIMGPFGLDFDALLMRIHPAASRVNMLAKETPSSFVAFDLLAAGDTDLREAEFATRRMELQAYAAGLEPPAFLSPGTLDETLARDWFERFEGAGLDGVIARPVALPYRPGDRALAKIKHHRTADCVVGGFRWLKDHEGQAIGSLLLGLHDRKGVLHFVGHTSSFKAAEKRELVDLLRPYITEKEAGFGAGRTPGAPNRWTGSRDTSWVRLQPELVCEVRYDQLQGNRFRSAATFLRWRPDKPPAECAFTQLQSRPAMELMEIFGPTR